MIEIASFWHVSVISRYLTIVKPIYYFDVKLHVSTERFLTGRGPREDHGLGPPSIYSCVYYLFLGVPIICVSDVQKFEMKIRLFFFTENYNDYA